MLELIGLQNGPITNITEPVDLSDVKQYLSIRDTDTIEDDFLRDAITECRSMIEDRVFNYVCQGKRPIGIKWNSNPIGKAYVSTRGPVVAIDTATATTADLETITITARKIDNNTIYIDTGDARILSVAIVYRFGYDPGATIKAAILSAIRNRYDRRTEDPITPDIERMIYTYTRPNA